MIDNRELLALIIRAHEAVTDGESDLALAILEGIEQELLQHEAELEGVPDS